MSKHETSYSPAERRRKAVGEKEVSLSKNLDGLLKTIDGLINKHKKMDPSVSERLFSILESLQKEAKEVDSMVTTKREEGHAFPTEHLKPSDRGQAETVELIVKTMERLVGAIDSAYTSEKTVSVRMYYFRGGEETPYYLREEEQRVRDLVAKVEGLFGVKQNEYERSAAQRDADIETRTGDKTGIIEAPTAVPGLMMRRIMDRHVVDELLEKPASAYTTKRMIEEKLLALDLNFSPAYEK